ncbi:WXG100 family type VII secretion target [Crossiella sp. SN42]|uniref:WXG100 family type VII secretion target n=1 Tax=Crossiella sp. SN42 TaxID=2944808 RepID=UPI00207CC347|nr:WXG100 family type VII secretion target [Crossiella sp. SN42]MCO1581108.1 WXG100 family type VII secretion target [Crossiella sp. SN42]
MSGFRTEHERLSRAAGDFDDYRERADAIAKALTAKLAELGECWGSDAVGRSFARTHVPGATKTQQRLGELPGELAEVGGKFARTAEEYRSTEQDNELGLRRS